MSDSVRPHRRQSIRLPCPWDSPGKNTGVGCHFLLQCMKVKSESEVAESCPTLSDPMDCGPPGSSVHEIFQARVLEWGANAFSKKRERGLRGQPVFSASALPLEKWDINIRAYSSPGSWTHILYLEKILCFCIMVPMLCLEDSYPQHHYHQKLAFFVPRYRVLGFWLFFFFFFFFKAGGEGACI